MLLGGEVRGTWRRSRHVVAVAMWRTPSPAERNAIEAEAAAMPLRERAAIQVRWD